jgi:uncharacterized lipoprotein YajG
MKQHTQTWIHLAAILLAAIALAGCATRRTTVEVKTSRTLSEQAVIK